MNDIILLNPNLPKALNNGNLYGVPRVIFDLKDSVLPKQKEEARLLLAEALRFLPYDGIKKIIRINDGAQGKQDLQVLKGIEADGWIISVTTVREALEIERTLLQEAAVYYEITGEREAEIIKALLALEGNRMQGVYCKESTSETEQLKRHLEAAGLEWIDAREVRYG